MPPMTASQSIQLQEEIINSYNIESIILKYVTLI